MPGIVKHIFLGKAGFEILCAEAGTKVIVVNQDIF
jgi:hypothetical protein